MPSCSIVKRGWDGQLKRGRGARRFGCMPVFGLSVRGVVIDIGGAGLSEGMSMKGRMSKGFPSRAGSDGVPPSCVLSSSRTSVVQELFCEGNAWEPVNSSASSSGVN